MAKEVIQSDLQKETSASRRGSKENGFKNGWIARKIQRCYKGMTRYTTWSYLLLTLFLLLTIAQASDDDWVDPTDMLNYDAASGKMKSKGNNRETDPEKSIHADMYFACEKEKKECSREKSECEKQQVTLLKEIDVCQKKEKTRVQESSSVPLLKRFLNKILIGIGKLGFPNEIKEEVHYDAEIILTRKTLSDINKFLTGEDWKSGALDDSLTDVLIQFKHHDAEAWKWKFEDYFGIDPYDLFMILLCLLCLVSIVATELFTRISWFTQLKRLFIISIIISIGWNWMYLYKVEFAKRQAEVAKMEKFDISCSEKMDWSSSFAELMTSFWRFRNDPCQEYYKAVIVSPALMVPPTKALALTFTHFVTEPLKHVGQGMGEFIKGLLNELPGLYHIPVLIVLACVTLSFCYGAGKTVTQIANIRRIRGPEREPPPLEDRRRAPDERRRIDYIENLPQDGGRGDADRFDGQYYQRYEDNNGPVLRLRARHPQNEPCNSEPNILQVTNAVPAKNQTVGRKMESLISPCVPHEPLGQHGNQGEAGEKRGAYTASEPEAKQAKFQEPKEESDCSAADCSKQYMESPISETTEEHNQDIQKAILGKITVETVTSCADTEPSLLA